MHVVCIGLVARVLLAKEKKEREEAEKKKHELEEQLNRYSTQYETTQQGSDLSRYTYVCLYSFAMYYSEDKFVHKVQFWRLLFTGKQQMTTNIRVDVRAERIATVDN